MRKKLFIPGPTEVAPEVLQKMATPMIGHRSKDASALQREITEKLRKLMFTQNPILLSTTSGSGLMEGAIRSITAKRAVVFSVGAFGDRWFKMAEANGVPADKHSAEMGKPTTPEDVEKFLSTGKYDVFTITHNETSTGIMHDLEPFAALKRKYPDVYWLVDAVSSLGGVKIDVDKLGIDVCITSTQKALALPPGMSIASVSMRALEHAKTVKNRGLYLDIVDLYNYVEKKDHQYPSTPSLSHMFALNFQLDRILAEGLDARFKRHFEMAEFTRAWAKKHFALFPVEKYSSQTLTTITNTKNISVGDLNSALGKVGLQISNGYGDLKEKTFRIAHMGELTMADMKEVTSAIEKVLSL
ncbi:MAG: alanine--glyoxylate aminotransferase family protein [Ignavibacteriales bacterium]|nr:alanine--glyoxylate aminotransferase family protein [Ignavibacteriales bacterium]